MRPTLQLFFRHALWAGLLPFALALMPAMAQTGVTAGFSNNQLSSLKSNGIEYLSDGRFVVNRVILADAAGNQTDGSTNGNAVISSPNTVTLTYSWGSVQVLYAPAGTRLNLTITTTNTSAQTIAGLFYNVFNLKFPSRVLEFDGVTPLVDSNIGAPTLVGMTSSASTMVFANDDVAKPLMAGFPWALDNPSNTIFPLRVNTNRDPMYPTFWPFISRPIAPGGSDQYHLSLRFGAPGSSLQALGGDVYQSFGGAFPSQFTWTDRRPIGMLVLGTSAAGYKTNPRGWLLDPTIDVTTPAGLTAFKARILQWADNSIKVLQAANAQGMITWDIEGEQFPQSTSYVCDPSQFAMTAPEMVGVADAYFQKFRDAGLKVGVCVRPQQFVLAPGGATASQQDVADPTQMLIDKINYARNRWGASMIYIDSDGSPGSPMDPSIMQRVSAAVPGVLIMPEHSNLQYYAYSAPYRQVNQGKPSAQPDARSVYPRGFAILNVSDAPIAADYSQLVTAVSQGDVLMFRGWFEDGSLSSVKSIYAAAGSPPNDTTPPSVSIVSPLANITISTSTTVSASAADNTGVARVQFLIDGSALGAAFTAPPYTTVLNPAGFANGTHTISATATDLAGNSASATVTITIANPDVTPPSVSVTSPANLSTVAGTVTLSASASDNIGIAGVQYRIDGVNFGAKLTAAPYTLSLNTATLTNGMHTAAAVATDLAGNNGTSATIQFTVNNSSAPASCATPATNAFTGCYYSGQNLDTLVFTRTDPAIHFDWSGTGPQGPMPLGPDNYSVRWLGNFTFQAGTYQFTLNTDDGDRLFIDGQMVYSNWMQHGASPVTVNASLSAGTHLIELDYFQAQGGAVAQLSWNGPSGGAPPPPPPPPPPPIGAPTISITSPANGATVSGTTTLTTSISAPGGIAWVQFQLDGSALGGQLILAPYNLPLNTTSLSNGGHTLVAMVRDLSSNIATSSPVSFTVSNAVAQPTSCGTPGNGVFTGCYYSGQNLDSFVFARTDPVIHFDWSGTGPQGPIALGPDNYSVRWQGVFPFAGGSYQFTVNTDDGGRLFIDGQLVYGNWTPHGALPVTVNATLAAGSHLIELDYFQVQGGAVAQLSWIAH